MKKHHLIITLSLLLAGCSTIKGHNNFGFYDSCAKDHSDFVSMATCGKKARVEYCKNPMLGLGCSSRGDAIVEYADVLVASVKAKEITDLQAQRRWIEFKIEQKNIQRAEDEADYIAMKLHNHSTPKSYNCIQSGNIINCN